MKKVLFVLFLVLVTLVSCENKEHATTIATLEAKVASLEAESSSKSSTISSLEKDVAARDAQIASLESAILDDNAQIATLNSDIEAKDAQIATLESMAPRTYVFTEESLKNFQIWYAEKRMGYSHEEAMRAYAEGALQRYAGYSDFSVGDAFVLANGTISFQGASVSYFTAGNSIYMYQDDEVEFFGDLEDDGTRIVVSDGYYTYELYLQDAEAETPRVKDSVYPILYTATMESLLAYAEAESGTDVSPQEIQMMVKLLDDYNMFNIILEDEDTLKLSFEGDVDEYFYQQMGDGLRLNRGPFLSLSEDGSLLTMTESGLSFRRQDNFSFPEDMTFPAVYSYDAASSLDVDLVRMVGTAAGAPEEEIQMTIEALKRECDENCEEAVAILLDETRIALMDGTEGSLTEYRVAGNFLDIDLLGGFLMISDDGSYLTIYDFEDLTPIKLFQEK